MGSGWLEAVLVSGVSSPVGPAVTPYVTERAFFHQDVIILGSGLEHTPFSDLDSILICIAKKYWNPITVCAL